MSSTAGENIKISLFGESHGKAIGMVIDSMPAGVKIDYELIEKELEKRKPKGNISTPRKEKDEVVFLSGVFNDYTTGSPLAFIIENGNTKSSDYTFGDMRPSHADLTTYLKYDGFNDYRGGGHTSGRITAPIVVLGAIMKMMLKEKGIRITSHIESIHGIKDDEYDLSLLDKEILKLESEYFACLNDEKKKLMEEKIEKARDDGDSVGGTIELLALGLFPGIGEPFFDSIESRLSSLMFSIGGVKGVSFGDGFEISNKYGSEVSDGMEYNGSNIKYLENHNGGINGGISNGNILKMNVAINPTPSISKTQKSVNVVNKESVDLNIKGRHDPCIVHRARIVIESLTAFALVDMIMDYNKRKW